MCTLRYIPGQNLSFKSCVHYLVDLVVDIPHWQLWLFNLCVEITCARSSVVESLANLLVRLEVWLLDVISHWFKKCNVIVVKDS